MSAKTAKSVAQLLKGANVPGANPTIDRSRGIRTAQVLDGLSPHPFPAREGLHVFTPEELLSLKIDPVSVNGSVTGYQRDLDLTHAKKIAEALVVGKPMPLIHIALDGSGDGWIVDGQHRAVGAIIAREAIEGVVQKLDKEKQATLFYNQRNAKAVDRSVLVLAGQSVWDRYVQEAVSRNSHPWHPLVSASRKSKTKITPYAMFQLLVRYVGNLEGQAAGLKGRGLDDRWDLGLADGLAPLISCFGNKQTHPLAFRPGTLQAIGAAAMWVFRRNDGGHPDDAERWQKHMPMFPFELWLHVRTQSQMTEVLLAHWNKRLAGSRKVHRT